MVYYGDSLLTQSTVFVVGEQSTIQTILSSITKSINDKINVLCFDNAVDALSEINHSQPDMVLTDYNISNIDSRRFIVELRNITHCKDMPIVVVTKFDDSTTRYNALKAGATESITAPFDPYECKLRFSHLLYKYKQKLIHENRIFLLEEKIDNINELVKTQHHDMLIRLAKAGGYKNNITGLSLIRMGRFAGAIAKEIGLDNDTVKILAEAVTIHDIGKIGIPDSILLKNGPLNEAEFEFIKRHPHLGHEILKDSTSPYLKMGAMVALQHHEKFDGSGYPSALKRHEITIESRIATIADVFDALISERPYKKAWDVTKAMDYIVINSGTHFDPECVKAFVSQKKNILCILMPFITI